MEKTGEKHSRLEDQLDFLENELNDIKQSIEINSVKASLDHPNRPPNIKIDHITIENIHIDQANLSVDLDQLLNKGLIDPQLVNQAFSNPYMPQINIRTRKNKS